MLTYMNGKKGVPEIYIHTHEKFDIFPYNILGVSASCV